MSGGVRWAIAGSGRNRRASPFAVAAALSAFAIYTAFAVVRGITVASLKHGHNRFFVPALVVLALLAPAGGAQHTIDVLDKLLLALIRVSQLAHRPPGVVIDTSPGVDPLKDTRITVRAANTRPLLDRGEAHHAHQPWGSPVTPGSPQTFAAQPQRADLHVRFRA